MQISTILSQDESVALKKYLEAVRAQTLTLCEPLEIEDFVVQPTMDVSPPKWHLAHTTWFFEAFLLGRFHSGYRVFHPHFHHLFNSYYIGAGERWARTDRGNLTRPTVKEIFAYREYVDQALTSFIDTTDLDEEMLHIIQVGIQHEQQHQELLVYDIKAILGGNPLYPVYSTFTKKSPLVQINDQKWLPVKEGVYQIGFDGEGYFFDNEKGLHNVFLHDFSISSALVTNREYVAFMESGGYANHEYWLAEGWDWVTQNDIKSPMYWIEEEGTWWHYTLAGLEQVTMDAPVSHISFFEADAFARWSGCRLPSEMEWEVAAKMYEPEVSQKSNFVDDQNFRPIATGGLDFYGNLWEWTSSPYRPYPYYKIPEGVLGEYNGKFMINQMVLRGGSYATPRDHIRLTYRNFFHPHLRWMCSGIRLAKY